MEELGFFPKISLSRLDKLGINYSVVEENENYTNLCTISISKQDYDEVYNIGWQGGSELLRKGEW